MNIIGATNENVLRVAYPGGYRPPVYSKEDPFDQGEDPVPGEALASAQIIELPDHYEVEVSAPGHRYDDFIVTTEGSNLRITALGNNNSGQSLGASDSRRAVFFDLMLKLPRNADSDFVRAEYKSGILNIWFRKADKRVFNMRHSIIVY